MCRNSDLSRAASDVSRSTVSSAVSDNSLVSLRSLEDDKDLEIESDMPALETVIQKDVLKKLKPKEKKRQEVINGMRFVGIIVVVVVKRELKSGVVEPNSKCNVECCYIAELFYTEANHVRNLRVLQKVFYQPLSKYKFSDRLLEHVFPNLDDVHRLHGKTHVCLIISFLLQYHCSIVTGGRVSFALKMFAANLNTSFKERRKENIVVGNVGDLLLATVSADYILHK